MDYKKYITHLENQFEKSFTFSKEVALKRDNKLIEGFIYKAEEEISFNDFYSSGNENILKYSGVLAGLEEKNYSFFTDIPLELAWKLHEIDKISDRLIKEHDENKTLFDIFKLGAEYCLYNFADDKFRYRKLDNRLFFQNILKKAKNIADSENSTKSIDFKNALKEGELIITDINILNKKLDSNVFLKKNAFYATKQFYWMHEKGSFDNMTRYELKAFYSQKVREEIKAKAEFLNSNFISTDEVIKINFSAS